jgi:hypothetical protein
MEIESTQQTEYPTLQNNYNCFQCTQCHQDSCCNNSKGCTKQYRSTQYRYLRQRSKQMEQQVTCKHVTIKSSSETNRTESVTNRLKLDKKRSHRPTRSTRLEQAYKAHTLTFHSQIGDSGQQGDTHSQSESSLSSNSRTKRYLSKGVACLQKEKQNAKPNYCCFSLNIRKCCPSSRQSICIHTRSRSCWIFFHIRHRTCTQLTPFQMNAFQGLSVPESTYRFTESRQSTISSLCPRMIQRMIHSQHQHSNSYTKSPNIKAKHRSHERLVYTNQRNTLPCFCSRSVDNRKIQIHTPSSSIY